MISLPAEILRAALSGTACSTEKLVRAALKKHALASNTVRAAVARRALGLGRPSMVTPRGNRMARFGDPVDFKLEVRIEALVLRQMLVALL